MLKYFSLLFVAIFASTFLIFAQQVKQNNTISYSPISGTVTGEKIRYSPDPLIAYRWANPQASDGFEFYTLQPLSVEVNNEKYADTRNHAEIIVNGECDIMFDFGQVNAAWFEFDSPDYNGEIEMSISEFNEPAVFNYGSQHPKKTAKPVKYGDTYRLELNDQLYEGVRFAWVHIKSLDKPMKIISPRLICQIKPTNYQGSFETNDTMLNRIWYTGAYTVKLNLLEDHFGAILMERSDRHSWTGDAHTSQAASMVSFGNYDFVKQNIRYTSAQYNGIASYSLYWVLSLVDYFQYTEDSALVLELLENAFAKLQKAYDQYGKNEQLVFFGWDERLGAGFEDPDILENYYAYHMLCIRSWNEFAHVLKHIGEDERAKQFEQYAREKINELHKDPVWWKKFGVHASADAVNALVTDSDIQDRIWENAFGDRMQRLSYSPFNQFFILQAMSKMNRHAEALTTIDDCWGGQIRYGGTTFFEVFRPSWNQVSEPNDAPINNQCGYTSLTHPWSAGVTKWLSEEILGIKPLTPGFAHVAIRPFLSSQITRVKGTLPTPKGSISFSIDASSGEIALSIPFGSIANLAIPKAGRKIESLCIDNIGKQTREDSDYVYYDGIPAGEYIGKVVYSGRWAKQKKEKYKYSSEEIKVDNKTGGDWKDKYGKKGYYFFNVNADNSSDSNLPPFVKQIRLGKAMNTHWASHSNDKRALLTSNENRNLGAIYTNDPMACMQTMTIDIEGDRDMQTKLSLYFVDFDRSQRRSAIEVFDLETKKLLKPVHIIDNYENGQYVTFNIDRPVRIRVNQVRGINAVCSALFFD